MSRLHWSSMSWFSQFISAFQWDPFWGIPAGSTSPWSPCHGCMNFQNSHRFDWHLLRKYPWVSAAWGATGSTQLIETSILGEILLSHSHISSWNKAVHQLSAVHQASFLGVVPLTNHPNHGDVVVRSPNDGPSGWPDAFRYEILRSPTATARDFPHERQSFSIVKASKGKIKPKCLRSVQCSTDVRCGTSFS